jgi:hypothetical protein
MINFSFNIRIPGSNHFENIRVWHGSLPVAYKHWELQIYFSADMKTITDTVVYAVPTVSGKTVI